MRAIDDLLFRERDTTGGGVLAERLYPIQDSNWNVTGLCDLSGLIVERYSFDAYGAVTPMSGQFVVSLPQFDWEILYAGYRHDRESGINVVRRRVQHPRLGCWMSRDLAGFAGGISLYGYVYGSPVCLIDPSGLQAGPPNQPADRWTQVQGFLQAHDGGVIGNVKSEVVLEYVQLDANFTYAKPKPFTVGGETLYDFHATFRERLPVGDSPLVANQIFDFNNDKGSILIGAEWNDKAGYLGFAIRNCYTFTEVGRSAEVCASLRGDTADFFVDSRFTGNVDFLYYSRPDGERVAIDINGTMTARQYRRFLMTAQAGVFSDEPGRRINMEFYGAMNWNFTNKVGGGVRYGFPHQGDRFDFNTHDIMTYLNIKW